MAAVSLFEEIEAPPACCSPVLDRHKGEELSAYKAIWQFQTRYVPEMEHMLKLPNLLSPVPVRGILLSRLQIFIR